MVTCDKMDLLHVGRLKNLFPSVVVNYVNNVYTTFLIHFMLIEKCGTLFTTLYWLYLMLARQRHASGHSGCHPWLQS